MSRLKTPELEDAALRNRDRFQNKWSG